MKNNITKKRKGIFRTSTLQEQSSKVVKLFTVLMMSAFLFSCDHMKGVDEVVDDIKEEQKARIFKVELQAVNNSGVTGEAMITYMKDGKFEVHVNAKNLAPNMVHPQHIHGFGFNEDPRKSVCAPPSAAGEDGLLTLEESEAYAGPALIPLDNELIPLTADDYPKANEHGLLNYVEWTKLNTLITAIDEAHEGHQSLKDLALDRRVVELHGAWVKDNQVVPAGTEGAEYIATLPVACGEVKEVL
jgi:hypothetical protein